MEEFMTVVYFARVGIALSVLLNVILGGKSNQTFSARNWDWKRNGYINFVDEIDWLHYNIGKIFGLDLTNHCMEAWVFWYTRKSVFDELKFEEGIKLWENQVKQNMSLPENIVM